MFLLDIKYMVRNRSFEDYATYGNYYISKEEILIDLQTDGANLKAWSTS